MAILLNSSDYTALKALYQSTNGAKWKSNTGWKTWDFSSVTPPDVDVVKGWFGVTLTGDRVTSIKLPENQLKGTLPTELGNLTGLTTLNLNKNQLSGSIPPQLGSLTSLTTLNLHENQLSGTIPKELGNLANLQFLSLALNNLSGTIPPEIVAPPKLQSMLLAGNKLSGIVPQTVTDRIKALVQANPTMNSLDNPPYFELPASPSTSQDTPLELTFTVGDIGAVGNTDPRRILSFATTDTPALLTLSPIAPGQVNPKLIITPKAGLYGSAKITLTAGVLAKNPKTGKIGLTDPATKIFQFTVLPKDGINTFLNADDYAALKALYQQTNGSGWRDNTGWKNWNFSSGNVPTLNDVAKWQGVVLKGDRVDFLTLTGNQLSGILPTELGKLTSARGLLLSDNQLSGSIPTELGTLPNLVALQLNNNLLSGEIPQSVKTLIGNLPAANYNLDNLPYFVEPIAERAIVQDSSLQLTLSVGDIDKGANADPSSLQLKVSSSNTTLIPDVNLVLGGTGANRTLTLNPAAGQTGSTILTLTLTDGKETTTKEFRVAVHAPDQPANGVALDANDYAALKALYTGTDGANWIDKTGWKDWDFTTNTPPNAEVAAGWKGVTVVGNRVKVLDLADNGLKGAIPVGVGNLTGLEQLYLNSNKLTGAIPTELGNLTNLKELYLCNNDLSSQIPTQLSNLTNLTTLDLANNGLGGEIPVELYNLVNLRTLDLSENLLFGAELSTQIGNLVNLENLSLFKNLIDGKLPVELSDLTKLKKLDLSSNQFSQEIPFELGDLTNLTNLDLSDNQLTGEIPFELGDLTNLTDLDLSGNKLEGEIPFELGDLTKLEGLNLTKNQLTGEIPDELGNLTKLVELTLADNQLEGEIPVGLGSMTKLSSLDLSTNNLDGIIPVELAKLTQLKGLDLSSNFLGGEVPKALKDYLVQAQAAYNLDNLPYIEGVDDQTIPQNQSLNLPIVVGDLDILGNADPTSLTLSAESDNLTLFPQGSIKIVGTGADRTLSITPAVGQTGTALINLLVSDGEEEGWSQFQVTVNAAPPVTPGTPGTPVTPSTPGIPVIIIADGGGGIGIGLPLIKLGKGKRGLNQTATNRNHNLVGTAGNDVFKGSKGRDRLLGKGGSDKCRGRGGNDLLNGGGKNDLLFGDKGNDRLLGGNGRDGLSGRTGDDVLVGGNGNDILAGGQGADDLTGGRGRDMFTYKSLSDAVDTIRDFSVNDLLDLRGIFKQPGFTEGQAIDRLKQFIRLEQVGTDTKVNIDTDGSGAGTNFTTLVILQNVTATALTGRNFVIG